MIKINMLQSVLRLIRVRSWIKNVLIFIPLIFGGIFTLKTLAVTIKAFLSFSLVSSAVYIINDIKDIESDKKHPVKSKRPLATGEISVRAGIYLIAILVCMGVVFCPKNVSGLFKFLPLAELFLYLIINFGYSFGLKNYPILDIVILLLISQEVLR